MPPPLKPEEDDDCIVVEDDTAHSANNAHANPQQEAQSRTTFLDALIARPEVRAIPWGEGKELPPDKAEQSTRYQVRAACILATRGDVVEPKCTGCTSPYARFSLCIALPDWFQGSCAGCTMKAKPAQCSLRGNLVVANPASPSNSASEEHSRSNEDEIEIGSPYAHYETNDFQANQLDDHNLEGEEYEELSRYDDYVPDPDAANTASYQAFWNRPNGVTEFERRGNTYYIHGGEVYCRVSRGKDQDGKTILCHTTTRFSNKQRLMCHMKNRHRAEWDKIQEMGMNKAGKKSHAEKDAAEAHFGGQLLLIKQADQGGPTTTRPQYPKPVTEPSRKRKRQSEVETPRDRSNSIDSRTGDESSALLNYVKHKEKRSSRRHFNLPSNSVSVTQEPSVLGSDVELRGATRFSAAGLSTQKFVAQQVPDKQRFPCHLCKDGKMFIKQDSLAQHLRVAHPSNNQEFRARNNVDAEEELEDLEPERNPRWGIVRTEGPRTSRDWPEPLIDTLPRNKQRQIYGIVSGLQGGIDHLQKELDALKKALGIEDED